jgi:glycosyltransferase involved in cell wall biosynthesis
MVPIHAAVTSPISRLFRIRHVLWYAHAVTPLSLRFANLFVNQILTSTPGSCNLTSRKVTPIGQGVDSKLFQFRNRSFESLVDVLYVGRTDESKNIPEIIDAVASAKLLFPKLQLAIVGGGPALSENLSPPWVQAQGKAARSDLPLVYGNADFFIHAFRGSLDKVLVEAALSGLPVITENDEFQKFFKIFGIRSTPLYDQLINLLSSDKSVISEIVEFNCQSALINHELAGWITKIVASLAPETAE